MYSPLLKGILNLFIYSNCILHPYGSSNYNTKACKHIKEKQHKHNKYVNVKFFALLYTDDTVLLSETSDGLQTLLNNFYEYSKLWKLKVNIDKTKIMVFSTSRTAENVHFLYNEKEIETVTIFNYLGVTFTKNGKFKLAKQKNIEKATKAMYEVIRRGKRHNLSIECLLDLFDKIVKPILLYAVKFGDLVIIM